MSDKKPFVHGGRINTDSLPEHVTGHAELADGIVAAVAANDDADATQQWRQSLWDDAANHLTVAQEATEHAQGCLEDLKEQGFADQLQPFVDALRRAAADARERTE